ncbi:glycosyltransferase [Cryobacterium frigoriphilum]|uniref:4,4'-diaponeurosporenoate glycosyltransferase n=1 Tax=Cryobacterium frigoriphilum TaxID=1259150 RepID=A0A4R9A5V1_9MICO|nr:glycosyltransferase [Cryobacterium frigoriphilum]TFD52735.1 glycosyltransferase [Cryobacterium frigoriphilum]
MTVPVRIDGVGVIIPVRNEELLLPRCLTALAVAIAAVRAAPALDRPRVQVVIVLDRCTDASASVAADWPKYLPIVSTAAAVGAARRAGAARLTAGLAGASLRHLWLATTDADSAVPPNWLTTQLTFARNGSELVLGTVVPDTELSFEQRQRWMLRHRVGEGHPYVHGANLGVRADRYVDAGGFACVDTDEDVRLVAALRAVPVVEARTALMPVLTSGRLTGRAPAGFAGFLQAQTTDARVPLR